MSAKKVAIKRKPTAKDAEDWITSAGEGTVDTSQAPAAPRKKPASKKKKVPMKRLTLDIPEKLHKKLKVQAAREGRTMADIIREILEERG